MTAPAEGPSTSAREAMRADVAAGLARRPRTLNPTYFYDEHGSSLFERITRQPEYYPTRAERGILESKAAEWLRELAPGSLVELGAGSAEKTRVLLDAATEAGGRIVYAPVDVSAEFLRATAERLDRSYPGVTVRPIVADLSASFALPEDLPGPVVVAFLGSTIGNFERADAAALLRRATASLREDDRLLLGVDLKKEPARLNAAYNDAAGVTAEFNRNVLRVLNRELGADFDVDAWRHHAFYDPEQGQVEMHLVATRAMRVTIPGAGSHEFEEGESIRTEISRKYDRSEVDATLAGAGFAVDRWFADASQEYAVVVGRRA